MHRLITVILLLTPLLCLSQPDSTTALPPDTARPPQPPRILAPTPLIPSYTWSSVRIIYIKSHLASASLDSADLQRGDQHSIADALALVPGVRFESRGPGGSRRITLRGSLLRSPFGVRGLKAYVDNAPLTGPDGNTPLEVIDVSTTQDINVIKGAHSSEFGPGTGGIMLFTTRTPQGIGRYGGNAAFTIGSFGYNRAQIGIRHQQDSLQYGITYVRERYQGYREQEANYKDFLHLKAKWHSNPRHEWTATAWYYEGAWELPGGLTDSIRDANPRSALPASVNYKAAVQRRWVQGILGHYYNNDYNRHPNFYLFLTTTAYGQATAKTNPYGTSPAFQGYKDEPGWAAGLTHHAHAYINSLKLTIAARLEFQYERALLKENENINGTPGPLRSDAQVDGIQGLASLQIKRTFRYFSVGASASTNLHDFRHQDRTQFSPITTRISQAPLFQYGANIRKTFAPQSSKWYQTYELRIASAYSPAAWWEILLPDASINTTLRQERGIQYEANATFLKYSESSPQIALSLYHLDMHDLILPYTDTLGITRYQNIGRSRQSGLEAWLTCPIFKAPRPGFFQNANLRLGTAYQHYRLQNDTTTTLPGVPTYTATLAADLDFQANTRLSITTLGTGPIWLDTPNTTRQQAYLLLNARLEKTFPFQDRLKLLIALGCNNITNTRYSNFLSLNDARARYWNPAPTRNYFATLQLLF